MKEKKIKLFTSSYDHSQDLEDRVNKWLATSDDKIIEIKHKIAEYRIVVMIVYEIGD